MQKFKYFCTKCKGTMLIPEYLVNNKRGIKAYCKKCGNYATLISTSLCRNHCWKCKAEIDSNKCQRDGYYGYICNKCGEKTMNEFLKIETICELRNIRKLVHFTRIDNLESILDSGLLSRHLLLSQNINFSPSDPERFDGRLNTISLSISFPNYRMFYLKSQGVYSEWVIVVLDPAVLWELDCAYCKTNAANSVISKESINSLKTVEAFEALFTDTYIQVRREDLCIPSFFTTDPQAEVLVYNEIPIRYISALCFERHSYVPDDMWFWTKEVVSIPIEIEKRYFVPRVDWQFWQNKGVPSTPEQDFDL